MALVVAKDCLAEASMTESAEEESRKRNLQDSSQLVKRNYHNKDLVARLLPPTDSYDQVELLRVVIQDKSSNLSLADLKPCGHADVAAGIFQRARPAVLQAAQRRMRCDLCESDNDVWLCLTCLGMFCSRENEGHHGLKHFAETGHCVILSLMSLNFWCYAHEQYLEHDFYPAMVPLFRAVHEIKHGEPAHVSGGLTSSPNAVSSSLAFSCNHVENSVTKCDLPDSFSLEGACLECGDTSERWVCLACFEIHCGRYAQKHMIQHNKDKAGHDICMNLKDLSIWCQSCQQYLDTFKNPLLVKIFNMFHKRKFKDEDLPEPLTYQALINQSDLLSDMVSDYPMDVNGS